MASPFEPRGKDIVVTLTVDEATLRKFVAAAAAAGAASPGPRMPAGYWTTPPTPPRPPPGFSGTIPNHDLRNVYWTHPSSRPGLQGSNPADRQVGLSIPLLGQIAVATGATALGIGVASKSLEAIVSSSRIMQTYLGTMGKVFGAAIDVLLAPFTPVLNLLLMMEMKLLQWLIGHGDIPKDLTQTVLDAFQHPERVPGDLIKTYRDSFGKAASDMFKKDIGSPFMNMLRHPSPGSAANLAGGAAKYIGLGGLGSALQNPSAGNILGLPFKTLFDAVDMPGQIFRNLGVPLPKFGQATSNFFGGLINKIPGVDNITSFNPFGGGGGGSAKAPTQGQQVMSAPSINASKNFQTTVNVSVTAPTNTDPRSYGNQLGRSAGDSISLALAGRFAGSV